MNLKKDDKIAVIGVSTDKSKYGHKVFNFLKDKKFTVYPINPKLEFIEDEQCYASLKELSSKPDIVVTVVPPEVTKRIVEQVKNLKIKKIWMQPGSESTEAIQVCKENHIEVIHDACIMLAAEKF